MGSLYVFLKASLPESVFRFAENIVIEGAEFFFLIILRSPGTEEIVIFPYKALTVEILKFIMSINIEYKESAGADKEFKP